MHRQKAQLICSSWHLLCLWHSRATDVPGVVVQEALALLVCPQSARIRSWGGLHGLRRMAGAGNIADRGPNAGFGGRERLPVMPCLPARHWLAGTTASTPHFPGGCTGKAEHFWGHFALPVTPVDGCLWTQDPSKFKAQWS